MNKYSKNLIVFCLCAIFTITITGCKQPLDKTGPAPSTTILTEQEQEPVNQTSNDQVPELDGYNLLWHDEFNGTTLDLKTWNRELREPGWTNNELQEYTESDENIFVRDGSLVLKALASKDANGNEYYTSGKVNSQNKQDFMYGKVVARAKVPEGQGLWPAIWMMPTDESLYGQWPKCGEIDIMEVLGSQPDIAYATIHYGEPHGEHFSYK